MGIVERKGREKEKRRKQILKAGEKIFLRKGLDNTTMQEIAKACEVSKGTLYLYFRNKEELFATIMSEALDVFISMMESNLSDCPNPERKLDTICYTYLEFCRKHREYFKLMNHMHHKDEHCKVKIEMTGKTLETMEKTQKLISIISTVLQEAKQAGLIRPELDSFQLTVVFWAASNGVIAFMDQVTSEPGLVFAKAVAKRPELSVLNLFTQLDHEKSLHTLWDLIGQAIKP